MKMTKSRATAKTLAACRAPQCFDNFPLPVVDFDPQGRITQVNQAACHFFCLTREELLGRSGWEFIVGDQVKQSREAFMAAMLSPQDPPAIRRTILDQQGRFHTCDQFRYFLLNARGERTGIRYISVEITELQTVADECKHSLLWYESLLESLSEAVVATDVLGFITYVNPAAERLIGWTARELQGKPLQSTLPLLDDATGDLAMLSLDEALERRAHAETAILDSEGRAMRVEIHSAPILDKETGSTAGVISVIRRLDGLW